LYAKNKKINNAFPFASGLQCFWICKMKYILIIAGFIFIGLAVLGVVLPGLPATPFLLLASATFLKSSPPLYNWLSSHNIFGPILKDFNEKKGISLKMKIISIILMWLMLAVSLLFFIENETIRWIVAFSGLSGTIVVLLIRTTR